ncbi:MAG: SAM-dependent methyltransferase [Saprospiraceae bacterium]
MENNIKKYFLEKLEFVLQKNRFVKLTLGKYRGEEELENIYASLSNIKDEVQIALRYKYKTKDVFKNYPFDEAVSVLDKHIGKDFLSASLFATDGDIVIEYSKKRVPRIINRKATFNKIKIEEHNKEKERFVNSKSKYLEMLGITNSKGEVKPDKYDKFRQIDKFIEIVDSLYRESNLKDKDKLRIIDYGSGKSYLTFALYDYFVNRVKIETEIKGVEQKQELVTLSNKTAKECKFENLSFIEGSISDYMETEIDIIAALHACDTATDDAIMQSVMSGVEIIILAPCCQKYVRKNFKVPETMNGIFKHGILEERLSVSITDGLRALMLESKGYKTKVFEFISPEHTAKNTMITAVKGKDDNAKQAAKRIEIEQIKRDFSIEDFYLDKILI